MFKIRGQRVSVMVLFAVTLHFFWAFIILYDPQSLGATGIASLYRIIHPSSLLVLTLVCSSTLTLIGLLLRYPLSFILLIPQQILLMMSAAGAIEAIFISQYADGVLRPWAFIAADQVYSIIAALGHTLAMALFVLRRDLTSW